jgi:hypothetical protein
MLNMSYFPNIAIFARFGTWLFVKQWSMLRDTHKQLFYMEDQEPSRVETIVKVCVLLWSATLLSLSYYEPPSGKKIVDFDPTFIASIFSASTASLGFSIKKKKDTIVDNKNSKVGIK